LGKGQALLETLGGGEASPLLVLGAGGAEGSSGDSGRSSVDTAEEEPREERLQVGQVGQVPAGHHATREEALLREEVKFLGQESSRLLARARQAEREVVGLQSRLEGEVSTARRRGEEAARLERLKSELEERLKLQKDLHKRELSSLQRHLGGEMKVTGKEREVQSDVEGSSLETRQEELGKVTREKNDLLQRVEHLEKKLQESCNGINRTVDLEEVSVNEERRPYYLLESPFDGVTARQAKRAYGSLDQLSVGLGAALRPSELMDP